MRAYLILLDKNADLVIFLFAEKCDRVKRLNLNIARNTFKLQ